MSGKIRVLLVDDHALFRGGIRLLLQRHHDFEVVGEAGDGLEGAKRAKQLLVSEGILAPQEMQGVNRVLDAAALTYVAAALQAIMQVLYYASILLRRRD